MRKSGKFLLLILTIIILCLSSSAYALSPEIAKGIDYLINTQNLDGSWGGSESATANLFYSTYEVSNSLYTIKPELGYHLNGFNYVISDSTENTIYLMKKTLVLKATGGDYSSILADLMLNQREDGGFGGVEELYTDTLNTA